MTGGMHGGTGRQEVDWKGRKKRKSKKVRTVA